MSKTLHILSQTISGLLYPLFMPTYGMVLYMMAMKHRLTHLPNLYINMSIGGTVFLSAIVPILLIILLWKTGSISSLTITDAKQRTTPYIYTLICFGFWCVFIHIIRLPKVWLVIAIGATCALLCVTIINYWWKISAHLTAMGGLLGGICSIALFYNTLPTALIIIILVLSLLLMYARLYLNAHTPLQVVCGYLLGILSTFIPNLIIYA